MKFIYLDTHDVYFNLAAEEYIFNQRKDTDPIFMIWQNQNAVVIGKHQNTIEEVNLDFVSRNHIQVARRMSGGGAVFHDLGNLNYSIIVYSEEMRWDIKRMADPIVKALQRAGMHVEVNERNDLLINGNKISGSSQYIKRNRLLHHGTLLFQSDLGLLSKALKPEDDRIESRSIKSVRSPVTNICDHYPGLTKADFIASLMDVLAETSDVRAFALTDHDRKAIAKIRDEKYSTWAWIYARSPEYTISKHRQINGCEVHITMAIKDGVIQSLDMQNDIAHEIELGSIEKSLIGVNMHAEDIANTIDRFNLGQSVSGLSAQDFVRALIN